MSDATDNRFYREPAAPVVDGDLRERIFHIVLTAQHAKQNWGNTVTIAEWARDQIMPELERQAAELDAALGGEARARQECNELYEEVALLKRELANAQQAYNRTFDRLATIENEELGR